MRKKLLILGVFILLVFKVMVNNDSDLSDIKQRRQMETDLSDLRPSIMEIKFAYGAV